MSIKVTRVDTWPVSTDFNRPYIKEENKALYDQQEIIFEKYRDSTRVSEKTRVVKDNQIELTFTSYFKSLEDFDAFRAELTTLREHFMNLPDDHKPANRGLYRTITVTDTTTDAVLREITYTPEDNWYEDK
jgi:hypothetical protein